MNARWISIGCWTVSALLIGGDLLWIALAEDKGTAIFGGIVAVGVSRVLIGEIAVRYDRQDPRVDEIDSNHRDSAED